MDQATITALPLLNIAAVDPVAFEIQRITDDLSAISAWIHAKESRSPALSPAFKPKRKRPTAPIFPLIPDQPVHPFSSEALFWKTPIPPPKPPKPKPKSKAESKRTGKKNPKTNTVEAFLRSLTHLISAWKRKIIQWPLNTRIKTQAWDAETPIINKVIFEMLTASPLPMSFTAMLDANLILVKKSLDATGKIKNREKKIANYLQLIVQQQEAAQLSADVRRLLSVAQAIPERQKTAELTIMTSQMQYVTDILDSLLALLMENEENTPQSIVQEVKGTPEQEEEEEAHEEKEGKEEKKPRKKKPRKKKTEEEAEEEAEEGGPKKKRRRKKGEKEKEEEEEEVEVLLPEPPLLEYYVPKVPLEIVEKVRMHGLPTAAILDPEAAMLYWRAHLSLLDPPIALQMHQERAVSFLLRPKVKGLILDHEVGSGKTLSAITAMYVALASRTSLVHRVLFIGDPSLHGNLQKEFARYQFPAIWRARIYVTTPGLFLRDFVRYNQELMNRYPGVVAKVGVTDSVALLRFKNKGNFDCHQTLVIVDEAHFLRTLVQRKKVQKTLTGVKVVPLAECAKQASKVLLLTGTPIYNRPFDIVNLVHITAGKDVLLPNGLPAMSQGQFDKFRTNREWLRGFLDCHVSFHQIADRTLFPTVYEYSISVVMDPEFYRRYVQVQNSQLDESLEKFPQNPTFFMTGLRKASNKIGISKPKMDRVLEILDLGTKEDGKSKNPWFPLRDALDNLREAKIDLTLDDLKRLKSAGILALLGNDREWFTMIFQGLTPALLDARLPTEVSTYDGLKAVIYSSFLDSGISFVEKALQRHRKTFALVTGKIDKDKRTEAVARFNAWPDRVVVVTQEREEEKAEEKKEEKGKGKGTKKKVTTSYQVVPRSKVKRGEVVLEPIQYLLITKAGGQGLDLAGGRLWIGLEPSWNDPNAQQSKARLIRLRSHMLLPPEQRRVDTVELFLEKPPTAIEDDDRENPAFKYSADGYMRHLRAKKKTSSDIFTQNVLLPFSIERNPDCIAFGF